MSSLPLSWRFGLEIWFSEENPFIAGVSPPPEMSMPFSTKVSASLIWLVLHPETLFHLPTLSAEGLLETVPGLKVFSKKLVPSPWFFPLLHFAAPLRHVPSWKIWAQASVDRRQHQPAEMSAQLLRLGVVWTWVRNQNIIKKPNFEHWMDFGGGLWYESNWISP